MKPAKILIVDRDSDSLLFLKNLLHGEGHTPFCASSVEEGMTLAQQSAPDLVILEAMMPGPGRGKQRRPRLYGTWFGDIPVLLCSHLTKESYLRFQLTKPPLQSPNPETPEEYLEKPLEKEDLMEAICRLLHQKDCRAGE